MRIYLLDRMERDGVEYPGAGFYNVSDVLADELVAAGKAHRATMTNEVIAQAPVEPEPIEEGEQTPMPGAPNEGEVL